MLIFRRFRPLNSRLLALSLALVALVGASPARATHLDGFLWDFEGAVGGAWSDTTTGTVSGYSGQFLGGFANETITLSGLDYLEFSSQAYIQFDLVTIGPWHGNFTNPPIGPIPEFVEAIFTASADVSGTTTLLVDASFATDPSIDQSYPDDFSEGSHPAGTGAILFDDMALAVYRLSFVVPNTLVCCTDVSIDFSAAGLNDTFGAQRWGLDNVIVSSTVIPEPSTGLLVAVGLAGLAAARVRLLERPLRADAHRRP